MTDQPGALSFMGIANVVAKMVIDDLNDRGGLLGRPVELFVEDSATDDSVAEAAAARLAERAVDVVFSVPYAVDGEPAAGGPGCWPRARRCASAETTPVMS